MTPQNLLDLANLALEQCECAADQEALLRWYKLSCQLEALSAHNPITMLRATWVYLCENVPDTEPRVKQHTSLCASVHALLDEYDRAGHLANKDEPEDYGEYDPPTYD